jgi:cytochrome c
MKTVLLVLLACAGIAMGGQARANADLAKARNCMGCHALDKKVLGPALRDLAAQ